MPRMVSLLLVAATCALSGYPSSAAGSDVFQSHPLALAGGQWRWEFPQPQANDLMRVICLSARVCYANGRSGEDSSELLATANGGNSWRVTPNLGVGACPTPTVCYALGDTALYRLTTDDGTTWQRATMPSPASPYRNSQRDVECVTATSCVVLDNVPAEHVLRTANGGRTWASAMLPPVSTGHSILYHRVACSGTQMCVAVGSYSVATPPGPGEGDEPPCAMGCSESIGAIAYSKDGARSWHLASVPPTAQDLTKVVCATAWFCATGTAVPLVSTDGGQHWKKTTGAGTAQGTVSCPAAGRCYFLSPGLFARLTGGTRWQRVGSPPKGIWFDLACPTSTRCVAVGQLGAMAITGDGGRNWKGRGFPGTSAEGVLKAASCPSAAACYAAGSQDLIMGTKDGGAHWTTLSPLDWNTGRWGQPHPENIASMSCPSIERCYAALDETPQPTVIMTADGGKTWNPEPLHAIPGYPSPWSPTAISCAPDTSYCTVAAQGGWIFSTLDGIHWSLHSPQLGRGLAYVRCFGQGSCVGLSGGAIVTTHDDWTTTTVGNSSLPNPAQNYVVSSSCPTSITCFVLYQPTNQGGKPQLRRTTDGGQQWTTVGQNPGNAGAAFHSIDCSTPSNCVLLGYIGSKQGVFTTSDTGDTITPQLLDAAPQLDTVACKLNSTRCVLVGDDGTIIGRR